MVATKRGEGEGGGSLVVTFPPVCKLMYKEQNELDNDTFSILASFYEKCYLCLFPLSKEIIICLTELRP